MANPSKLDAELIEGFVRACLLKNFDNACQIPSCHREWWEACCSSSRFVAIAAPRGFAKSTAITHSYTLAKLLYRESNFVVIVSDSESQAALFLNDIKKELTNNEELRGLFGVESIVKDAETDFIVQFTDKTLARVMAKGSEQKLRGLKWLGKRPNLVICDDMENDELVMNKERRDKFKKWFGSALIPVLSDKGVIRIVGTILHADGLLESFMPQMADKNTVDTPLKVYSKYQSGWYALKYRAHNTDMTRLLWPEKRPATWLRNERAYYESLGQLDVYSQEYLNNPVDESSRHFRSTDFLDETPADREKPLTYYLTMDLAVTIKTKTDYSVFLISGMDAEGNVYLKHCIRERLDVLEIADTIFMLVKAYDPVMVVTEKGTITNSILPSLEKRMLEENVFFRIELFPSVVDKLQRSQSIRLRARAGKVKANKQLAWWPTFIDEILGFPQGSKKDDQVDAFSLIGQALRKFYEAPTRPEIVEEAYEEEMQLSGLMDEGRSIYTGY